MKEWGPLDFIGYIALGAAALFLAINSGLALPGIRKNAPDELKNPRWGFLPIACFVIATLAFVAKLLITSAPEPPVAPVPVPSVSPPITTAADAESIRHLSYQLSQEISDFIHSYAARRLATEKETSSEQKAADTEALELEMSNAFKEKFKFRYLSLLDAMSKMGVNAFNTLDFNHSIIGPGEMLSASDWLSSRARALK